MSESKRGRKRSSKKLPPGIIAEKLPSRVWFNALGNGSWRIFFYDEFGRRKSKRLAGPKATLSEIWAAYANYEEKAAPVTFLILCNEFEKTHIWQKLSPLTRKDYDNCKVAICSRDTTAGSLGGLPASKWTPGLIRKLLDKRASESESRANKELAYIKRIFSWAESIERVPDNPAKTVKKLKLAPRQHYATDRDYQFQLSVARDSPYWYIGPAMELAYLCRMRLSEVIDLRDANETEAGLFIQRRKGSKANVTRLTGRLVEVWQEIKTKRSEILARKKIPVPIRPEDRYVFISERTGDKISADALESAFKRVTALAKQRAEELNIVFTPFWFHDLKRKGVSDTDPADRLAASGHRSPEMLNVYAVLPDAVDPTKNGK